MTTLQTILFGTPTIPNAPATRSHRISDEGFKLKHGRTFDKNSMAGRLRNCLTGAKWWDIFELEEHLSAHRSVIHCALSRESRRHRIDKMRFDGNTHYRIYAGDGQT